MTVEATKPAKYAAARPAAGRVVEGTSTWERDARLWAGMLLFVFVLTHLLNHALGIFGVEVMETAQTWRVEVWRSWPGSIALYGAALVHAGLALKRALSRRTWRMPILEAVQIVLGVLIPVLLVDHLIGTRYLATYFGVDDSYRATLQHLWPSNAVKQIALLLIVWFHGVIGIHYAFRSKLWYPNWRELGLVLAFAVPLVSIAGFVVSGREAGELEVPSALWNPQQIEAFVTTERKAFEALVALGVLALVIIAGRAIWRRLSKRIKIRYVGHGEVESRTGATLLEISRANAVPHPSICGGRGRCGTCRVLVLSGLDNLPKPGPIELKTLERISAPPRVRLACNIWPADDLAVQILLPITTRGGALDWEEEAYKWGVDREVTVLFVDIRAFTALTQKQLPSELVVVLNRVIEEMTQAVEARGGRVGMFLGDGLMAIFGLGQPRDQGSKAAIRAALDMLKSAKSMNEEFSALLPLPLRLGIGIHSGKAVIARIGDADRGYMTTALGETVSIAGRLEAATKELLADCLISEESIKASGLPISGSALKELHVKERSEPVKVHALRDVEEFEAALN